MCVFERDREVCRGTMQRCHWLDFFCSACAKPNLGPKPLQATTLYTRTLRRRLLLTSSAAHCTLSSSQPPLLLCEPLSRIQIDQEDQHTSPGHRCIFLLVMQFLFFIPTCCDAIHYLLHSSYLSRYLFGTEIAQASCCSVREDFEPEPSGALPFKDAYYLPTSSAGRSIPIGND